MYIHPESERYVVKTLAHIKSRGAAAGIAINPDTSLATVEEMLNLCDYVMVMTVNPGFAGPEVHPVHQEQGTCAGRAEGKYGFKLMIDGSCSPAVIEELSAMGADGFILGTSALFGKGRPYAEIIPELRGEKA